MATLEDTFRPGRRISYHTPSTNNVTFCVGHYTHKIPQLKLVIQEHPPVSAQLSQDHTTLTVDMYISKNKLSIVFLDQDATLHHWLIGKSKLKSMNRLNVSKTETVFAIKTTPDRQRCSIIRTNSDLLFANPKLPQFISPMWFVFSIFKQQACIQFNFPNYHHHISVTDFADLLDSCKVFSGYRFYSSIVKANDCSVFLTANALWIVYQDSVPLLVWSSCTKHVEKRPWIVSYQKHTQSITIPKLVNDKNTPVTLQVSLIFISKLLSWHTKVVGKSRNSFLLLTSRTNF